LMLFASVVYGLTKNMIICSNGTVIGH
jgi:hypothetical protein